MRSPPPRRRRPLSVSSAPPARSPRSPTARLLWSGVVRAVSAGGHERRRPRAVSALLSSHGPRSSSLRPRPRARRADGSGAASGSSRPRSRRLPAGPVKDRARPVARAAPHGCHDESARGYGVARTPWRAVQRAAWPIVTHNQPRRDVIRRGYRSGRASAVAFALAQH